jgi:hypothetical protein
MTYRSQSGSRHGSGEKFQKSAHEKAKARAQKRKSGGKYVEEAPQLSLKEVAEKTVASLNRLGSQTFALSPFNQYFDDWLMSLRQVTSEFESSSGVSADEQFVKERTQIFADVEASLAEKRIQESTLTGEAKALADNNHLLVELDKEYAEKTRELSFKRNAEVQRLTHKVHDLEPELAQQKALKISVFKPLARRAAAQKLEQTTRNLSTSKNELEVTVQNFSVEQEKLHDDYQKRKQEVIVKVESLETEIEKLETDNSINARQASCNALSCAVNALIQRTPSPAKPET